MVNTKVIAMQNTILFKWFSRSCKRTTFLLFHHVFLGILKWHKHCSLNENSVKPNIKADRSGFFIYLKSEITMKFRAQTEFCQIQMTKLYKIVCDALNKQKAIGLA